MFLGLWHESQSWQHWMYEHYELNAKLISHKNGVWMCFARIISHCHVFKKLASTEWNNPSLRFNYLFSFEKFLSTLFKNHIWMYNVQQHIKISLLKHVKRLFSCNIKFDNLLQSFNHFRIVYLASSDNHSGSWVTSESIIKTCPASWKPQKLYLRK